MRIYFIFSIKQEFVSLYKDNQSVLFSILKQIYNLDNYEVNFGYNLFNQLINIIEKNYLDRYLFLKLHQNIPYSKRGDVHIYNNLYKDEVSRLLIKKSFIRLEVNHQNSTFFDILRECNSNYFVCDFKYQDYFFLSDKCVLSTI